ncbi:hypothetical protein Sste5346_009738, partial [Sporothrix stenoceras]
MDRCLETGQVTHIPTDLKREIMEEEGEDWNDPDYFDFNLADIIQYRLNMAEFAEHILTRLGLPRPNNQSCLAWDDY